MTAKTLYGPLVAHFSDRACARGLAVFIAFGGSVDRKRCLFHCAGTGFVRTGPFHNELLTDAALLLVSTDLPLEFPVEVTRHLQARIYLEEVVAVREVKSLRSG